MLDFNGSNTGEIIDVSANGPRVRFTRNIANIVMDLGDVERINVRALGGADSVAVNDLTGTDAESVDVDLERRRRSRRRPARQRDRTRGGRRRRVRGGASSPAGVQTCRGWPCDTQRHVGGETGNDGRRRRGRRRLRHRALQRHGRRRCHPRLRQRHGGGRGRRTESRGSTPPPSRASCCWASTATDTITAVGNLAPLTAITMDGGDGDDTLRGGNGADLLLGGTRRTTSSTATRASTRRSLGRGDDTLPVGPRRRQRHRRGPGRHRPARVQRQRRVREHRGVRQRPARALHPQHRQHRDGPRRRRARSTSARSAASTT